jgi:hypothetical protein
MKEGRNEEETFGIGLQKLSKHTVIAEIKARGQFVISTKWQVSKKTKLRNEKAHSP